MNKKNIVHLFPTYLHSPFLYFFIRSLDINNHYVITREIRKNSLTKFPYDKVLKTSKYFKPLWLIDKIFVKYMNIRILNIYYDIYIICRKLKRIDLIHAHFGSEGYYAISLAKKNKVPLIVTFYGYDMSSLAQKKGWKKRFEKLFGFASVFIVEGEFMKKKLHELGCLNEKIFISRLAILTDNIIFNYRPKYDSILKVFMCANFVEKKGYDDAILTFSKLKQKGYLIFCEIVGDGILENMILKLIIDLDLKNEIKLLGRKTTEEIYEISQKHHVFFHPSKFGKDGDSEGGAPTIISEMQALGLPIIATKHADIPNVIPAENQFLAKEGDIDDLVAKFEDFMKVSKNWNSISVLGRKFVVENHDSHKIGKKLENIYHKYA